MWRAEFVKVLSPVRIESGFRQAEKAARANCAECDKAKVQSSTGLFDIRMI